LGRREAFGHIPTMDSETKAAKIQAAMEDCTAVEYGDYTLEFNHPNGFVIYEGQTVIGELYINMEYADDSHVDSIDRLIDEFETAGEGTGRWRESGAEVEA
jgi:hypothetical protein